MLTILGDRADIAVIFFYLSHEYYVFITFFQNTACITTRLVVCPEKSAQEDALCEVWEVAGPN